MKKILAGMFLLAGALSFVACNDGVDYEKMRQEELAVLKEYMDANHPGAKATPSGLYYFNEAGTGTGDTIQAGDQVQLYYATWVLKTAQDCVLVDQSNGYLSGHRYEPYSFVVGAGSSIKGLEEAVGFMQAGTKSHLVINSELAYGQRGSGSVPSFATVLMEVEVKKFTRPTQN